MKHASWVDTPEAAIRAFTWVPSGEHDSPAPHHRGRLIVQEKDDTAPALAYEPVTHEWFAVLKSIVDAGTDTFPLYWDIVTLRRVPEKTQETLMARCSDAVLGTDVCLTAARIIAAFIHEHGVQAVDDTVVLGALAYATQYHRASAKNALSVMDGTSIDDALDAVNVDTSEQLYRTIGSHNEQANADMLPDAVRGR